LAVALGGPPQTEEVKVSERPARCLVTGATGYVGSRLVPELLEAGYQVRCMSRSPARLRAHPWIDQVEAVAADARDARTLGPALAGVDVAFYLVHSLGGGDGFEAVDRAAARTFAAAAQAAGVRRIVYLGGLRPAGGELSAHLRSRSEVGDILLESGVPTVVLRAAVIIGAGSASFEMLRYLTERLPVMVAPRWVATRVQPIAIPDVLRCLVGCAGLPGRVNRAFDIGGPEVLTYADMMRRFAAVAGLPRRMILVVPLLTPALSSLWIGLVTPVPAALARPLVDSLYHEVVCRDRDLAAHLPDAPAGPIGFDQAVRLALRKIREVRVAAPGPGDRTAAGEPLATDPGWAGGSLYRDVRVRTVSATPETLWQRFCRILGDARGRSPTVTRWAGITWQVDEVAPGRLLRLRADGPFPGIAWLELGIRSSGSADSGDAGDAGARRTGYIQRALFHPHGLLGHLCWWAVRPYTRMLLSDLERRVTHSAPRGGRRTRDRPAGRAADPARSGAAAGSWDG
jgi:uncharacterized protein YbjT (DUF2867 family)